MLIDERPLHTAESAVSARKALLAQQWAAARSRLGDNLVEPSTLLTAAAIGGILGWRGAAPKAVSEKAKTCEYPPPKQPSLVLGLFRSVTIAGLQVVASIASEEFIRSTIARGDAASGSATAEAVDASR
jgi:hypothetical protein